MSSINDSNSSYEGSHVTIVEGKKFYVRHWKPKEANSSPPKGLVVLYHGLGAHSGYPTVRYAAEFLQEDRFAVVAVDFPGHGQSDGLPGYIPSSDELIANGVAMVEYATSLYQTNKDDKDDVVNTSPRLVLCGSSMGGAIAQAVAHRLSKEKERPRPDPLVMLLAPMLMINVSGLERTALQCLSYVVPTAKVIPSSATDASKQYRDPTKRQKCEDDKLTISGNLRIGSVLTCVDLTLHVQSIASEMTCPYLLMIADEDVVVKNEGSEQLWNQTDKVTDKTKKHYPALHGLLCEPSPLFDEVKNDMLSWLNDRV